MDEFIKFRDNKTVNIEKINPRFPRSINFFYQALKHNDSDIYVHDYLKIFYDTQSVVRTKTAFMYTIS